MNQNLNLSPTAAPMPVQSPAVRHRNFEEVALGYDEITAMEEARRCLGCPGAPCRGGCPVGVHIPQFIAKVAEGDFAAAWEILSADNTLPAVCGRVCPQENQCQAVCVRGKKGESVAIGRLERFVADWHRAQQEPKAPSCAEEKGKKVAVVGSGPAGLACAGELARMGYSVTVFEALHTPGGVLAYGIPAFRLPKDILHEEIAGLEKLGVTIQTDTVIGRTIPVEELLKAVCVASGNDAAAALAEKVAGVSDRFVEKMNQRAAELGMNDTHFANCTGLTAEGHVTSAYDIAVMSRELILKHPDIRRFTTIWMDTIRGGAFQLANTNKLIRFYDGATGLKTGYTASAGYCISATAERDGMELIAVVMKGPDRDTRNNDAKALLNYGFSSYALVTAAPEQPLMPVPVDMGTADTVQPVLASEGNTVLVEKEKAGMLERKVTLEPRVTAPVAAGQPLGELTVLDGDTVLLTVPITAGEDVMRRSWGQVFTQLLRLAVFAG